MLLHLRSFYPALLHRKKWHRLWRLVFCYMVYTSFTENPFETLRVKREKNFWGFLYIFSWWMVDDSMIQPPQKKKHVLNHVRWMAVWNMANVWMAAAWNMINPWVLPLFWKLQMSCRFFVFLNHVPCCHPNICHPRLPKSSRYTLSDPDTVWVEGLLLSLMFGIIFVFETIYWHHHSLSKTRS